MIKRVDRYRVEIKCSEIVEPKQFSAKKKEMSVMTMKILPLSSKRSFLEPVKLRHLENI